MAELLENGGTRTRSSGNKSWSYVSALVATGAAKSSDELLSGLTQRWSKTLMPRIVLAMALTGLLPASLCSAETAPIPIIDCHVHLWDIGRPEGITWINKETKVLYRNYLPVDHEPIAEANLVKGVVIVQAGQSLPDNQWNLDVTAHNKILYRGVIGNLSKVIGTPDFKPLFAQLCEDPRYVGYRLSDRHQKEVTDAFYFDLQLTADKGKVAEFLVGGYSFEEIAEIAKRLPNLRIMLDHFGGVQLNGAPLDPKWVERLRAVAHYKNVFCKVSALYGRVKQQPAPQDIGYYSPVIDLVFDCFGEDRLIYGSDWPVTETTGDYASVVKLTKAYFDRKGREVSEKFFHKNAATFYRLPDREPKK